MSVTNLDILNAHIQADDGVTRLVDRTLRKGNFPGGLSGAVVQPGTALAASGAMTVPLGNAAFAITAGAAAALTIPAPVVGTDDYKMLTIVSATAQAHTVTQGTVGFNAKGASGVLTWTAAKGNSAILMAYQGNFYVVSLNGVTVS